MKIAPLLLLLSIILLSPGNAIAQRKKLQVAPAGPAAQPYAEKLGWKKGDRVGILHNTSYGWELPAGTPATPENLQKMKTRKYIEALRNMKPGLTMVIMHGTDPTEAFEKKLDSGATRQGDLLAMPGPALRETLRQEGTILTTWREVKERREKVAATK